MPVKSSASKARDKKQQFASFVLGAAVLLPGIIAGLILYLQRLPYPYQDDYNAILAFAYQYHRAPSLSAKLLQVALFQHNSYRLIFEHGIIGAEISLTHHLNFAFLTALGDLFLLGIVGLLWRSFERKPSRSKLLYFLPVSLMFFSLTYWETLNWAMTGLSNVPVIFFALFSIYLLGSRNTSDHPTIKFLSSCIAALLACCSLVNGFLLAPVGVLILASQRRYKHIIFWLFSFILPLSAYMSHPNIDSVQHSLLKQVLYFIAFFGGAFHWHRLAFVVGLALLSVLAWAARSHFMQRSPVLFPFALWIVLTGALIESVRGSITSRYSIYSVLMVACCYIFLLHGLEQEQLTPKRAIPLPATPRLFLKTAIAFCLCFYVTAGYSAYRGLHRRREMVLSGLRFYRADPLTNSPQSNPAIDAISPEEKPFELFMLHRAAQDGLYVAPSARNLK